MKVCNLYTVSMPAQEEYALIQQLGATAMARGLTFAWVYKQGGEREGLWENFKNTYDSIAMYSDRDVVFCLCPLPIYGYFAKERNYRHMEKTILDYYDNFSNINLFIASTQKKNINTAWHSLEEFEDKIQFYLEDNEIPYLIGINSPIFINYIIDLIEPATIFSSEHCDG